MHRPAALLALVGVAAGVLAVRLSRDEYGSLVELIGVAEQRSPNAGFWPSTLRHSVDHCSSDYYDALLHNFNQISGPEDRRMARMYRLLDRAIMHYCDTKFLPFSKRVLELCRPRSDCGRVTNGFKSNSPRSRSQDAAMALALAQVMMRIAGADIASAEQFRDVYADRGPCRALDRSLHRRYMRDYVQYFLTLAPLPNYYADFDRQHQRAADIIAACNHVDAADGFLDAAHSHYANLIRPSGAMPRQREGAR